MNPGDEDHPPKAAGVHTIGQNLDALSLHEIDERIAMLHQEIARLETARNIKTASQAAAHAFFSSPHDS
jgi:uncharacterized small protein (DUF1192 family)